MKTQHYKGKATTEHHLYAKPGQFVFKNNDSDEIIGFIDFVSDKEISMMLFEPDDLPEGSTSISETCDWLKRLKEIFEEDPEMEEYWKDMIYETSNSHS